MRRREFIAGMSSATLWPLTVRGQQSSPKRRVGVFQNVAESDSEAQLRLTAFRRALTDLGWIEGHNLQIEYRWMDGKAERAAPIAKDLVNSHLDAILVVGGTATTALLKETKTIPVVFQGGADPVAAGIVPNFARPGGNVTGFTFWEPTTGTKLLGLLKEVAPNVTRGIILTSGNLNAGQQLPEIETVRASLGIEAIRTDVRNGPDIQRVLHSISEQRNFGLIVVGSTVANVHRDLIVVLATKHKYPAVYPDRAFVTAGGLLSYGIDNQVLYQQAGTYIARILNGAKAGDLPVQNPTKYEMVINLKAAKAIDIEVPPTLLARADEVIE